MNGWMLKHGKDKKTGEGVMVHRKDGDRGLYEIARVARIMHAGDRPLPRVPHEWVPIDQIELEAS
jgi:hypothetical protein